MPEDAPEGLCPNCVLNAGLQTGGDSLAGISGGGSTGESFVPPTPAELAPHFPDLEILELVGRGGMGMVYKARQTHLGRLVALKILSPSVGKDPAFADRFAREARAMAILSHPHIVTVHDFGQKESLYYFLMEFVDGLTLRQLLDAGKLATQEALAIVPQICEALQFAHDKGVVHRDIKPENILMDRSGQVKIADFGLAKLVGQEGKDFTITGAGQVMGTPYYMAPEQTEHPEAVDHRADIYSLGVVFYQMLTGELPIGRFAPPSKKVEIDVRLDEVVLRALEKEPQRRYQQASQIKTEIDCISGGETGERIDAEAATGGAKPWKARRAALARWSPAVVGGLVVLTLGGLLMHMIGRPRAPKAAETTVTRGAAEQAPRSPQAIAAAKGDSPPMASPDKDPHAAPSAAESRASPAPAQAQPHKAVPDERVATLDELKHRLGTRVSLEGVWFDPAASTPGASVPFIVVSLQEKNETIFVPYQQSRKDRLDGHLNGHRVRVTGKLQRDGSSPRPLPRFDNRYAATPRSLTHFRFLSADLIVEDQGKMDALPGPSATLPQAAAQPQADADEILDLPDDGQK